MREDTLLRIKLINQQGSAEGLRHELTGAIPARAEKIAESADMPLSREAQQVLTRAAEEAEELKHRSIDSGHLVLGVFGMKGLAAAALDHHGVTYASYREALAAAQERPRPESRETLAAGSPAPLD